MKETISSFNNDVFEIRQISNPAEIVFVDSRVTDPQSLLSGLSPSCEAVFIDAGKDGLKQMADYLSDHPGSSAVHILAHGSDGRLLLGNSCLDSSSTGSRSDVLSEIGKSLSENGDILIYSCGFGAGEMGPELVSRLSAMTGADVAASDNLTGKGGDWVLEIKSGEIEAGLPFSSKAVLDYDHDLTRAPIMVTTKADSGAGSLRDPLCQ